MLKASSSAPVLNSNPSSESTSVKEETVLEVMIVAKKSTAPEDSMQRLLDSLSEAMVLRDLRH